MAGLDFNNPVVVAAAVVAVVLLLDLLMAGGAMTSTAACGVSCVLGTHFGWLGILLIGALVWLALGGAAAPVDGALVLLVAGAILAAVLGLVAFVVWHDRATRPRPSSAEVLRLRYSRGELTRQEYRQMLVDVLKDRYVRGDLDVEGYEAALGRLLEEPRPGRPPGALAAAPAGSAPDVFGDAAN